MDEEKVLDSTLIEEHYSSLISASGECTDPITVEYDNVTNISVRDDSENAYTEATSMASLIKSCISADSEHLSKIGQTFFTLDDNVSSDIDSILNYE